MSNLSQPLTYGQLLDQSRSDAAREIERVTESLTRYWNENGTCEDEKREFRVALRQVNELTETFDDDTAEYLHLTLLKDWFRSLYGHSWDGK